MSPSVQRRRVWLTTTTRVPCSNAAKTRSPLKLPGVTQTNENISAASGPKFTILWGQDENIMSASAMQGGHKQKHIAHWHSNKQNYSMNWYVFKTKRLHSGSGFQHFIPINRICNEVACIKVDFTVLVHKAATTEVVVSASVSFYQRIWRYINFYYGRPM